jgi:tetratricopeptide (TPR) repeat protein
MATMSRVTAHYIKLFVYPFRLAVDYAFEPSASLLDPKAWLSACPIAALIALILLCFKTGKTAFLMLWFFAALLPVSGIFPIKNFIAERYLYIPVMGWCGAAGMGFAWLIGRKGVLRILSAAVFTAILCLFILKNNQRNRIWHDEERFFRNMVRVNPLSYKGYSSLGMVYYGRGRLEEAEKALKRSVDIHGAYAISRHNLGCILMERGKEAEALAAFKEVIALDPSFTEAHYQTALLLRNREQISGAERHLRTALRLNPNFIPAKFVLASILQARDELKASIRLYEEILAVDPEYAKAVKNLGIIYYYKLKDPVRAAWYFRRYLALVPDDPQRDLIRNAIESIPSNP